MIVPIMGKKQMMVVQTIKIVKMKNVIQNQVIF